MKLLLHLLIGLSLAACATHAPRRPVAVAPAPHVNTGALAKRIEDTRSKVASAGTHTDTAIQLVDRIITVADPAISLPLGQVKTELLNARTDLLEANLACTKAVSEREVAQEAADKLEAWGVEQQQIAAANGEGWRKSEALAAQRQTHILKLQSMIGLALGIAAGIIGLKFFGLYGMAAGPIAWLATYFLT